MIKFLREFWAPFTQAFMIHPSALTLQMSVFLRLCLIFYEGFTSKIIRLEKCFFHFAMAAFSSFWPEKKLVKYCCRISIELFFRLWDVLIWKVHRTKLRVWFLPKFFVCNMFTRLPTSCPYLSFLTIMVSKVEVWRVVGEIFRGRYYGSQIAYLYIDCTKFLGFKGSRIFSIWNFNG